ncbi:MAG: glycosyltransferase [Thermoplasmatota archaeon]
MPVLSVVIPTYNEAANIGPLLGELKQALAGEDIELIVVDDNSSDDTGPIAKAAHPEARVIVRTRDRGLATAVVRGIQEARGTYVAVIDADFQHPPAVMAKLLAKAREAGADLVVGSRYVDGGSDGAFPWYRRLMSVGAAGMARIALPPLRQHGLTDPMSGLFLVRRNAVALDRLQPSGYKILLEIIGRSDLRVIEEVGYTFQERRDGDSKLGGAVIWQYLVHLAALAAAHEENKRLVRFGLVGLSGVIVNLGALLLLKERAGLPVLGAAAISVEASIIWNFLLNDRFTFADRRTKPWRLRILDFHLVSAFGYVTNLGVLWGLNSGAGLDYRIAELVAIGVAFFVNYVGNLLWTYKAPALAPRPPPHAGSPEALREALEAIGLFESDVIEERPWGIWVDWYRLPEATLKCMVVKPGARMSLQKHRRRREVWRVVAGTGQDEGPDPPVPLLPGKTHVVGLGAVHRIANTGDEPLVIVEMQVGDCSEDDIIRLEDDYDRGNPPAS